MRFEKLNENKIRIILNNDDLVHNNIDFHSFMSNPIESQTLFFDLLNKAEKEIGFTTKNYNIKIEAMQVAGKDFIITVTRSMPEKIVDQPIQKKIKVKRKNINLNNADIIYFFNSFENFCNYSNFLKNSGTDIDNIAKNILLYEYNDNCYLVFSNVNENFEEKKKIFSSISEFATYIDNSTLFLRKLNENGKLLMKNNAIKTAIEYFK